MSRSCSSKIIFCLNNIRWESLWFISFEAYSDEGLHLLIAKNDITSIVSQREVTDQKNAVFGHFPRSVLKKQPPEVFFKKAVLKIFRNTYRKVPMLDSFVNKVTGLEDCNLNVKKETPTHVFSSECCQIIRKIRKSRNYLTALSWRDFCLKWQIFLSSLTGKSIN